MKIVLESEESILLEPTDGPMTIEAASPEENFSAFHMLGAALGYCTFSVLYSWASNAELQADDLKVRVRWNFVDNPHRVGRMELDFIWPSLPPARVNAAHRVAGLCAVHATLTHPPQIVVRAASSA